MSKRNYTHVQAFLPAIQKMVESGMTQRGRKPAKTLAEYKYENKRLQMENELLRDFLQSTERK